MIASKTKSQVVIAGLITLFLAAGADARDLPAETATKIDRLFSQWGSETPGCAVGISDNGSVTTRAYGMADLEHDVRNMPETIFEAGSVSKQFTAAAVLILANEGRLSLDDDIRKHLPEMPDYGTPITIRHLLHHTAGLRDWGNLVSVAGWPRSTRVTTMQNVLDITARQRSLNFPVGTRWSYSNTGYNLAAIIVQRVSGKPFAEFTRDRIFQPLGMTRSSWRDDYQRIVRDRAIAYTHSARAGGSYRSLMPFENVIASGGMLTTVGDLLKWKQEMLAPRHFSAAFFADLQTPGRYNDGRGHDYALGLLIHRYKGVAEIWHNGATAGYRSSVTLFPAQKLAIAILCNGDNASADRSKQQVADLLLGDAAGTNEAVTTKHNLSDAAMADIAGVWRNLATGAAQRVLRDGAGLRLERGPTLHAQSATLLLTANGDKVELESAGRLRTTSRNGTSDHYERVPAVSPDAAALAQYAGSYESDEAEARYTASVLDGELVLQARTGQRLRLAPIYADAFTAAGSMLLFRRDGKGGITELGLMQDRMFDLRFRKLAAP